MRNLLISAKKLNLIWYHPLNMTLSHEQRKDALYHYPSSVLTGFNGTMQHYPSKVTLAQCSIIIPKVEYSYNKYSVMLHTIHAVLFIQQSIKCSIQKKYNVLGPQMQCNALYQKCSMIINTTIAVYYSYHI